MVKLKERGVIRAPCTTAEVELLSRAHGVDMAFVAAVDFAAPAGL